MSQQGNQADSGSKCTPKVVALLLFVGFIFGFSIGFATKDIIHSTVTQALRPGISPGEILVIDQQYPTQLEVNDGDETEESIDAEE